MVDSVPENVAEEEVADGEEAVDVAEVVVAKTETKNGSQSPNWAVSSRI